MGATPVLTKALYHDRVGASRSSDLVNLPHSHAGSNSLTGTLLCRYDDDMASKPYFILVTGSRDWEDPGIIERAIENFPSDTVFLHGEARGADSLLDAVARDLCYVTMKMAYFDWLGRSGGPSRNQAMLNIGLAMQLSGDWQLRYAAFDAHPERRRSGTHDMMRRCFQAGIQGKTHYLKGADLEQAKESRRALRQGL